MPEKKPFTPNFKTSSEDFSREEKNKLSANLEGHLAEEFRDHEKPDITWESEQIAKSHGIYLEFDRSVKGREKDWFYMIRIGIPSGGPITPNQWCLIDDLADKYGKSPEGFGSLRTTTRQAIQYHWLSKEGVLDIVKTLAESGLMSLNACGDNTRNVMSCPLSRFSNVFNGSALAHQIGEYFQLPLEPHIKIFAIDPNHIRKPKESFQYGPNLLNRKFKIAVSALHQCPKSGTVIPDNCVELRTNDMSIAPIANANGIVDSYQIYVGGGQGQRNGKPSIATLGQPLGIISETQLMPAMDAIVKAHQDIGDRQNRHWARLKYVIQKQSISWFRKEVESRLDFTFENPNPDHDYGNRDLHHGWTQQASNGLWAYGAFIENGRIMDNSPNGKLKTMIREMTVKYKTELMITPNQDILFCNIETAAKKDFENELSSYGFGQRNNKPYSTLRKLSGACVGRDTCRLTYTDSEKFEPFLIDELENLGWGDLKESIGITGCERQCFRPGTKTIGLVGSGLNRYQFKLFGDESGRFQGQPLISSDGENMYLRSVPRESVAVVIHLLFQDYSANKQTNEGLGAYQRRIGSDAIIKLLLSNEVTSELMDKPFNTACEMPA